MRDLTLDNLLNYIDEAVGRQKLCSSWLDDQYDKHTTDVGYICEGLEIMKNELIRTFGKGEMTFIFNKNKQIEYITTSYLLNGKRYYFDNGNLKELVADFVIPI